MRPLAVTRFRNERLPFRHRNHTGPGTRLIPAPTLVTESESGTFRDGNKSRSATAP